MFQESFVPVRSDHRSQAVALPLALVFHAAVALALIVGPLVQAARLPPWIATQVTLVPPPPHPTLPAPGPTRSAVSTSRIRPVAVRMSSGDGRLVAPLHVPDAIREETLSGSPGGSDLEGADFNAGQQPLDAFVGTIIDKIVGDREVAAPPLAVVRPPRLIRRVAPEYPEIARQARVSGTVKLEATTDVYGRVKDVRVVRSIPLLDQAAVDAVRQWVYEPIVVNGRPLCLVFTVSVSFVLNEG
jgi:protein TonB